MKEKIANACAVIFALSGAALFAASIAVIWMDGTLPLKVAATSAITLLGSLIVFKIATAD